MALLGFLSARLRFLRDIPPLPHLLDALLWIHTWLFRRKTFDAMESVFEEVLAWEGVTWHLHRFGGREWRVGPVELGHLHGNGVLDVLLPGKTAAEEAVSSGRAALHHTHPRTAWVSLPACQPDAVRELLRIAWRDAQSRSSER